jgi:polar amino acid transport system permease protein
MALSLPAGLALAALRLSPIKPLSAIVGLWVEFWRSTPLLLQLFWFYFVLPVTFDLRMSPFVTAMIVLVGAVSAYFCEAFRGGIISIRQSQRAAGLALGMTSAQVFRRVVAPQAVVRVLPSLANAWVSSFKDTALLSVVGVQEMSYAALLLRTQNFRTVEVLTALAVLYLILGYPQGKVSDYLQRRFQVVE